MPMYEINCAEGSCDCYGKTEAFIPYEDLTEEQLDAINEGESFQVYPENVLSPDDLDPEDAQELNEEGSFWDTKDYREVCAGCGSESSPGPNGTRIYD